MNSKKRNNEELQTHSNFGIIYPFLLKKHWYIKNRSRGKSSRSHTEKRLRLGDIRTK